MDQGVTQEIHKFVILTTVFMMLGISMFSPESQAKLLPQQQDVKFTNSATFETGVLDLRIVSIKLQAVLTVEPQFSVTRSQGARDAGGTDSITIGLTSRELKGSLILRAVDKDNKVLASRTIPFEQSKSPIGETRIQLPEAGIQIAVLSVTISPRIIVKSTVSTNIDVVGPASISARALEWSAEDQRVASVSFQNNRQHVTVAMVQPKYSLAARMEFALKAVGIELTAIGTPSVTATSTGTPDTVAVGDYNAVPLAAFSFDPAKPTTSDIVGFSDRSTDADGRITEWRWSFGDGTTLTQQNPTHKFSTKGSYTVTLTVKDDEGATHSESKIIEVTEVPSGLPLPPEILMAIVIVVVAVIATLLYMKKKAKKLSAAATPS